MTIFVPECCRIYVLQPGVKENSLVCDSGPASDWIVIFRKQSWLQHLVTSDMQFVYGTNVQYYSQPLFSGLCNSGKKQGRYHPIMYALLPNKQCTTYVRMLKLLKEMESGVKPASVVWNYKQAAHFALKDIFSDV